MNSIIYISDAYSIFFPENTIGEFNCLINKKKLDYLPQTPLLMGIKSITFKLDSTNTIDEKTIFALKSNIIESPTVQSSNFSYILVTFTVLDNIHNDGIRIVFENPIFFPTSLDRLHKPSFSIVNLDTNKPISQPNFKTTNIQPTVIQCCIKSQISNMKAPLKFMLESNDPYSKKLFPSNNNINFTVALPRNYNLENEEWGVCLKSLHMSNKLYNIPNNKFNMNITSFEMLIKEEGGGGLQFIPESSPTREPDSKLLIVPPGYYGTNLNLRIRINQLLKKNKYPIELRENSDGRFIFRWDRSNRSMLRSKSSESDREFIKTYKDANTLLILQLELSPHLSTALGFQQNITNVRHKLDFNSQERTPVSSLPGNKQFTASFPPNLLVSSPKEICVQCNLIDEMCVGQESMRMLNFISIGDEIKNKVMTFHLNSNDYSKLKIKSFESINIRITDVQGKDLQLSSTTASPSVVHIVFTNL